MLENRFQRMELIGQGGLGDVYRGIDTFTQQVVAIKMLKPEIVTRDLTLLERFKREAEILATLDHPNIVKIITSGEENGQPYIVMEYLEGKSLAQLLLHESPLSLNRILEIALDLTDALTRAHRQQVIHRDIKPSNVLFSADGVPHLTDFGVARLGTDNQITQAGMVIGSYSYISPEACNGQPIDERTDIWSFGIMLYEMLTGQVPFRGDSPSSILAGILTNPVPDLTELRADIPRDLQALVYGMLEKNPTYRIDSMRKVGAALEGLLRKPSTPQNIPAANQDTYIVDTKLPTPMGEATPNTTVIVLPVNRRWIIAAMAVMLMTIAAVVYLISNNESINEAPEEKFELVTVAPAAPDEYMVLVGQLEPVNTSKREVTRFIVDDLRLKLEQTVSYTQVVIREYPYVIQNETEAREAAELNNASLIVWGHYTDARVEVNIQVGSLVAFPFNQLMPELLSKTLNVRVQLENAQQESIAPFILNDLIVLLNTNGSAFEAGRGVLGLNDIGSTNAAIVGDTLGAKLHRFFGYYLPDPVQAIEIMNTAIVVDSSNPILYQFRALAYQRLGEFEKADEDLETGVRIAGNDWLMANILRANIALFTDDPAAGIAYLNPVMEVNDRNWFLWYLRGIMYYMLKDYPSAESDFQRSLELQPIAMFPYISLAQIATRQGKLDEASAYMQTVLSDYSDPTLGNRILIVMYGEALFYSHAISAYGNFIAGQYTATVNSIDSALELNPEFVDLLFLKGIALCSLEKYEEAEAAYSRGIELEPDFYVMYLLRAEVRAAQGNFGGSLEDFMVARDSELADVLDPFIQRGITGEFSCKDFLQATSEGESE